MIIHLLAFLTVSNNDPNRDAWVNEAMMHGFGAAVDHSNSIRHFPPILDTPTMRVRCIETYEAGGHVHPEFGVKGMTYEVTEVLGNLYYRIPSLDLKLQEPTADDQDSWLSQKRFEVI